MHDFHHQVIDEFRANRGQVGGYFEGARLLLLTTTGARSGRSSTVPLGFLPDGERKLIIGSAGGGPKNPAWYHNLRAHPRAIVEDGVFKYEAEAVVLEGSERDAVFARAVEADPGWGDYETKSGRRLPVVALTQVGPPLEMAAPDESLKVLHDAFRRELALVRAEIAASGPGIGAQLRINCLTLCQGLHHHHRMEDDHMFPHFDQRYPEIGPALARLREEHQAIQHLMAEFQAVVTADSVDPAAVLADVDRLIADLESHLAYEEEHLLPLLRTV